MFDERELYVGPTNGICIYAFFLAAFLVVLFFGALVSLFRRSTNPAMDSFFGIIFSPLCTFANPVFFTTPPFLKLGGFPGSSSSLYFSLYLAIGSAQWCFSSLFVSFLFPALSTFSRSSALWVLRFHAAPFFANLGIFHLFLIGFFPVVLFFGACHFALNMCSALFTAALGDIPSL
jgi:hypothetical protein